MLTDEEFITYWQENSQKEKSSKKAFMLGLSSGFAIGTCVILAIFSGWYLRATMIANSNMNLVILFLAIIGISVFIAFIYRNFKWEMQEQRYLELVAKKKKKDSGQL